MAAPSSTEDLAEEPDAAEWPDSPQASSSRAPNTDVAEAKQAVAELEQEKQGLTVQVKALGDYLDKEVTLEEVKDAGVRGLGKNPTDEEVKARFAKLEDRLSSLHEELRRARRTLAIAMQNETQARQVGGASTPLTVAAVQSLGSKAEGTQMLLRQAAFATRGREYFQKACSETRESVGTDVEARIKRTVQERSQSEKDALCMVCGAPAPAVAHLLPNEAVCRRLGVPFDESNFLLLCGTKEEVGTCHHDFDTKQFGFQHMPNGKPHEWRVLGGPHSLAMVNLWTNPHARVIAAHLAEVILARDWTPKCNCGSKEASVGRTSRSSDRDDSSEGSTREV
eukprot:Rhum_TRINITY_DN14580_c0_g1::Rhum_TRINITY_DN14580_c0_g1_i5::g.93568::m.93568